jgi:hypothetical protein
MRAIEFDAFGDPSVLQLVKAPNPRIAGLHRDRQSDITRPAGGDRPSSDRRSASGDKGSAARDRGRPSSHCGRAGPHCKVAADHTLGHCGGGRGDTDRGCDRSVFAKG